MACAAEAKGKLRIGDDWNAIRMIALSQSNPLKAIAELVENSIDAHARKMPCAYKVLARAATDVAKLSSSI
jgi:hypothetical protein